MGIATQYLFNFVVVMVTPTGIARIGGYYYIPWAISNAGIAFFLYWFFPEPARLSLEQVDLLFLDGKVNVRRSPRAKLHVEGIPAPILGAEHDKEKEGSSHHELA
jgi:hypothetical protein